MADQLRIDAWRRRLAIEHAIAPWGVRPLELAPQLFYRTRTTEWVDGYSRDHLACEKAGLWFVARCFALLSQSLSAMKSVAAVECYSFVWLAARAVAIALNDRA